MSRGDSGELWSGRAVPRVEDPAILRGWGTYVGDVAAGDPNCLHARFVRSPFASGTVTSISAPPGVTMFTAADLVGVNPIRAELDRPDFVPVPTPILADDVVRFVGDPIAVVVAETEAEAEDAAERVQFNIDELAPVTSVADALRPGSPLVHDVPFPGDRNTVVDGRIETPGFAAAL